MTEYQIYKQFMDKYYPRDNDRERWEQYESHRKRFGYKETEYVWEGDPCIVVTHNKIPIAGYLYAHKLDVETVGNYIQMQFGQKYNVRPVSVIGWDVVFEIVRG